MSETKEIMTTISPNQVYFPDEAAWKFMVNWGAQAIESGLLPSTIKTPEAAAIIVLKGRELGISFMTAISHVHVINGKPSMSAELIQGLARKNLPGLIINIIESDEKTAKIEFIRPEKGSKPYVQTWSLADAEKAKVLGKDVWKQYPAAMLWSRAVTAGLRKVCPEALMGISYTPEEMGAITDGEGNVIETTGRTIEPDISPQTQAAVIKPIEKPIVVIPPVKPPVEDSETLAKTSEWFRTKGFMASLALSEADLKQDLKKEFDTDSYRALSLEQRKKYNSILEEQIKLQANARFLIPSPNISHEQPDFGEF